MATTKNNRWRSRVTYDAYWNAFCATERTEVFCDTETGGIHAFRTEGEAFDKALASIMANKESDDIFLGDCSAEPSAEDIRLASAIAGDDLLQFSAIKYRVDNGVRTELEVLDLYIMNRQPIDPGASKVNHITEESLKEMNAPDEDAAFEIIKNFFADSNVFIAYNEPFDFSMLEALYVRHGEEFNPLRRFDVMAMGIDLYSMYKMTSRKLKDVAKKLGVATGEEEFHNALDDIRVTVKVFEAMAPDYEKLPEPVDTSKFRTPRIRRHWVWQNPSTYKMVRIYFQTDCGKIFMEKLDRSFGTDGTYSIDELNMEGFQKAVLDYFKVDKLEDVVHLKLQ